MGRFIGGIVLPSLLLAVALLNWSLISLVDLIFFLLIRYTAPKRGFRFRGRLLLLWSVFLFSLLVIFLQVIFLSLWIMEGGKWHIADVWWAKLIGLMKLDSWRSPRVIYFLVIQLLVALVAALEIQADNFGLVPCQDSSWGHLSSVIEHIGSHLRVASCLLLPVIQLVVGISYPSWVSLPFFICSCVGLVYWSLTSNFLGLFRWWRPLWMYAGINICLLYVYQIPFGFLKTLEWISKFVGLYKLTSESEWPEICSYVALLVFYFMISCITSDLEDMDFIMSVRQGSLAEQLLPSRHSFFIQEFRSSMRHANLLFRGSVFRTFSINFFTFLCLLFPSGVSILPAYVHLVYLHMLATLYMPSHPCFNCTG
ncbi:hypothetical protein NMG60_11013937 [Bertholletia excelsa]